MLVGTRKGAFILTSDGKREKWDVSGPHFGGWEIYHLKGSPADPEPALRLAVERLVRPGDPALGRRRQDVGAGRQQVRLRRRARHAPVVRRHAAPVGVQARLAPRAVADRSRTRSTPASRTRRCSARPTAARPGTSCPGCARHGSASVVAAGRRRHVPAHDPRSIRRTRSGCSSRSRRPARSAPTTAAQTWRPINRGPALRAASPIPTPRSATACTASRCIRRARTCSSCRSTGTSCAATTRGDSWHEVSGNLPTDFGFPIDVHAHEPETIYVVPIKSDSEHYPPDGKLRVYRSRTGGNEWEALTNGLPQQRLLRERAARRDGGRLARSVRRLLRHDRRPGVRLGRRRRHTGRRSSAICRPCCRSRCRRCHDPRRAAGAICGRWRASTARCSSTSTAPVTQRSVLDALEARYPMLRGTIRDHVTQQRRPFVRFFACEEDLSHEPPDAPLPDAVADGRRAVPGRRRDGRRLGPQREKRARCSTCC